MLFNTQYSFSKNLGTANLQPIMELKFNDQQMKEFIELLTNNIQEVVESTLKRVLSEEGAIEDRFITIKQFCEKYEKGYSTILKRKYELPISKDGGMLMVNESEYLRQLKKDQL